MINFIPTLPALIVSRLGTSHDLVNEAQSFESYGGTESLFAKTKFTSGHWNEIATQNTNNENGYDNSLYTLRTEDKPRYPTIQTYKFKEFDPKVNTFRLCDCKSFHNVSNFYLHTDHLDQKLEELKYQRLQRKKEFYVSVKRELTNNEGQWGKPRQSLISVHNGQDNAQTGHEATKSRGIIQKMTTKSRRFGEATIRLLSIEKFKPQAS